MDICIAVAFSSALLLRVASPLTLSWQHSVEHFEIDEEWQADAAGLTLREVRIHGLGAGVDLPDDAQSFDCGWRFTPKLAAQGRVVLANSRFGAGYRACWAGQCAALADLVGGVDRPLVMTSCEGDPAAP